MPPVLAALAAWSWRLIVIGIVVYYTALGIGSVTFVALPVAIAMLLTALLYPLTRRLRAVGLRPIWATWITMLAALAVIGGTGWIVGVRANDEFPRLAGQVQASVREVQHWLTTGPLKLQQTQISGWTDELLKQLQQRQAEITGTLVSGAAVAVEVLASLVLLLFITFFLLKDGDRIWLWFLRAFGRLTPRVDRAGRAAWRTLSLYVQGTVAVAAVHGVVMGIVLAGMGVPLWAGLAVLIFLASFIPIVGIFFAGAVATLVTLGAKGWVYALIFLGILVVEQQLENHVLQPLIVGRAINFHPLAVILVLALGGIQAGIAGAAIAVPIAAVLYRALPELRKDPPVPPSGTAPPATGPPEPGPKPEPGPSESGPTATGPTATGPTATGPTKAEPSEPGEQGGPGETGGRRETGRPSETGGDSKPGEAKSGRRSEPGAAHGQSPESSSDPTPGSVGPAGSVV
ncbi:AI-2E family transporter [Sinosporangium album]|uniref:AI-2E family transporter n=1 Tax=Sinosporangium album TaxID=504805 RepID=UPI001FE0C4C8|nr:AI-2E family transporter [Sinosporangium album]